MSATDLEASASLLFDWDSSRDRSLTIVGFIAGSALLHALCFYVFQVVYPTSVALMPPPARLTLIAPNSEEGRSILRWVDAEDPALAFATVRPPEARVRNLPRVQHIPSYLAEEPKLLEIPPLLPDTRAPSPLPPGPVPVLHRQTAPTTGRAPTRIQFSEELVALGQVSLPAPHFTASSNESPQSVAFRIGISPHGEIRYCFRINSSGDPALDEQARQQLMLARFPPTSTSANDANQALHWGIATFEWGNDVSRPLPPSPVPTP